MNAKNKKIIIAAAGVSLICTVGIMLLLDDSDKETRKPTAAVKGEVYQSKIVPVNKPLITKQPPKAVVQKPQVTKPANKSTVSIQPKQQPIKRAVTALKLEEATSIAPRKKPQQSASKITTKKITTLKLKQSTVVESMHKAWVIQLGSFGNTTNAINLSDKLKRAGFASFVEAAQINNKKITRIYIGPETTLHDAKRILAALQKEQNMKGIIVGYDGQQPYLTKSNLSH